MTKSKCQRANVKEQNDKEQNDTEQNNTQMNESQQHNTQTVILKLIIPHTTYQTPGVIFHNLFRLNSVAPFFVFKWKPLLGNFTKSVCSF
jgi:hypothetical protein